MVQAYDVAPDTAEIVNVPVNVEVLILVPVNEPGCAGAPDTFILRKLLLQPVSLFALTLIVPDVKLAGKVAVMLLVVELPVTPLGKTH
jgi:hypothetical protein